MSSKLIILASLALVLSWGGYAPADDSLVVHYEFAGNYDNSGTGTVVG